MKRLAWIDLETTGLDEKTGCILEVGLVITNEKLETEAKFHSRVLPQGDTWVMDSYVAKMHQDNGLTAELYSPCYSVNSLNFSAQTFVDFIYANNAIGIPLAGSCPSFDRTWLRHHMPRVEALFSHRHFDVSTLRILHDVKKGEGDVAVHRVMADIAEDIELTKRFLPKEKK